MRYLDEPFARFASDALGRGIGCNQCRILGLKVFQLPHQLVELGAAVLRMVEDVIQIFVVANFFAEGFDLFFDVFRWGMHRKDYRRISSRRDSHLGCPYASILECALTPSHPPSELNPPSTTNRIVSE